jgi:hypothetical protein
LFVGLADPDHHREVIHQPTVAAASDRAEDPARRPDHADDGEQYAWRAADGALRVCAQFFAQLREKAEQLDTVQRWYRVLSEALRRYLRGRHLTPPARLQPA